MGGAKRVDGVMLSRASTEQLKELRELLVAREDVRGVKKVSGELSRRKNGTYGHSGPRPEHRTVETLFWSGDTK